MRNATGELPDRLHLLRLPELVLSLRKLGFAALLLGNIAGDAVDHFARRSCGPSNISPGAVLVTVAILETGQCLAGGMLDRCISPLDITRLNVNVEATADQFFRLISKRPCPGRVDRAKDTLPIDHQKHVLRYPPDLVAFTNALGDLCFQGLVQMPQCVLSTLAIACLNRGNEHAANACGRCFVGDGAVADREIRGLPDVAASLNSQRSIFRKNTRALSAENVFVE